MKVSLYIYIYCRIQVKATTNHKTDTLQHALFLEPYADHIMGETGDTQTTTVQQHPPCSEANLQEGEAANYGYAQ